MSHTTALCVNTTITCFGTARERVGQTVVEIGSSKRQMGARFIRWYMSAKLLAGFPAAATCALHSVQSAGCGLGTVKKIVK